MQTRSARSTTALNQMVAYFRTRRTTTDLDGVALPEEHEDTQRVLVQKTHDRLRDDASWLQLRKRLLADDALRHPFVETAASFESDV